MKKCALLTVFGHDRPGIVARVTRVLYETGCNLADSSMTRLGSEFTVMLVVWLPAELSTTDLYNKLTPVVNEMGLDHHIKQLDCDSVENPNPNQPERECIISVLGADQPGIVCRVAEMIQNLGGSVADLYTQLLGSAERPVYSMIIEAEFFDADRDLDSLQQSFRQLAAELKVEINLRPVESDPL